jgi:hypothetical protein
MMDTVQNMNKGGIYAVLNMFAVFGLGIAQPKQALQWLGLIKYIRNNEVCKDVSKQLRYERKTWDVIKLHLKGP